MFRSSVYKGEEALVTIAFILSSSDTSVFHKQSHITHYPHTTQNKLPTIPNIMFFFGSSRVGKPASEATQTPRASTSSGRITPTPAQQQARKQGKQGKKLSVAEDYWTNPALWPVGAPAKRS